MAVKRGCGPRHAAGAAVASWSLTDLLRDERGIKLMRKSWGKMALLVR